MGKNAIVVRASGTADYPAIARTMARIIETRGGEILVDHRVIDMREEWDGVVVETEKRTLRARFVVVCGGLMADRLAQMCGIDIGGVLPNALALASELSRPGREATAAGLIGIGITCGAMAAGLVAAALMPTHGWQSVFVVGGLMPIAIIVALQFLLPESPAFLTRNRTSEQRPRSTGPAPLFRDGRRGQTVAIWLIFIAVLMCVYLLSGWIPLLLNQSGFSSRAASLIGTAYQGGGVIGGIVASLMLHRSGWNVVAMFAGLACLTMVLLVWGANATLVLVVGVTAAGFFVTGTQNAINGGGCCQL